jgi:hypothetical protein
MIFCSGKPKLTANKKMPIHKWPKKGKSWPSDLTATRSQMKNSEKTFPTVEEISKNSDNNLTTS